MIEEKEIKKVREVTEEFFIKMTLPVLRVDVKFSTEDKFSKIEEIQESKDVIDVEVKSNEPQILIGQQGQTLFEIQRLLRLILVKKIQKIFYLNLDINDYKKKKIEYLKNLAKDLADQVSFTKESKEFLPMPPYERRIIHAELSLRNDIKTESVGQGNERRVIVKPK